MAAYSGYQSFKGNSSAKTWLHTILKNKVADYYRKKYKTPAKISLESYFDEAGIWRNGDNLLGAWEEANITGNYAEFDHLLENCIENLAPKWKIPIKLYFLQEKKTAEKTDRLLNIEISKESPHNYQNAESRQKFFKNQKKHTHNT